uniref:photosystem I subunit III n=1 Tax=Madagascaria erythrocladioides TaxID=753684 RepID=UPI001FCDBDBF|nr:photosystem I subunit III [Madagascaria erythrocladioides]UNJ16477.1 photosystem I subunit III [Madagascaria erythrocladioides]
MKKFITLLAALSVFCLSVPLNVNADVAGLSCKDSAAFQKRLDNSVKKLEGRLKKYEANTPPALALEQQINKTKNRFDRYSKSTVLCGTDGLPHLIADGRWSHAGEFVLPGLMFLYTTGWIGWVGRSYLKASRADSKPTEKEIIIDVPLAVQFMLSGFLWPFAAWQEFSSGNLLASADEITVSPR